MLKKIIAMAALSILAPATFAAMPDTFYAGIDGGSTKVNGLSNEGSYGAFLGYNLHQNFAAEIGARRLGNWDVDGVDVDFTQYSVSIIGNLPLQNNLNIYGRLGYNKVKIKASYMGFSADENPDGVLYGAGVGYNFTPTIAGRIEFQKPSNDSHNLSAGIAFQF